MKKKLFENVGGNKFKLREAIETAEYTFPSHWASYLINGDASGLEDAEQKEADEAIEQIEAELNASVHCVDAEEQGFARKNDYNNMGGDVSKYTFHVFKKPSKNVDENKLKLKENSSVISDIEAQKDQFKKFEIDYSQGATFANNLLALYGIGKRGRVWLTSFDNNGEPMSKEEILNVLNQVGLGKLASEIPADYSSEEGFKGTHS
jgi:hypothetical protein